MIRYLLWRVAVMIPTLILISMLVFAIIELPPGDYFESYVQELRAMGETADLQEIEDLKARYGFDQPMPVRYLRWVGGMLHGDFGYSFEYRMPVSEVVASRMWLTVLVSMVTIIVTWVIAFPIGIYSATHQYSWGDYGLTFLGLLGIAVPNFMLALIRGRQGIGAALNVASLYVYDEVRLHSDAQPLVSLGRLGRLEGRVARAIRLMEENLETPLAISAIARRIGCSTRTLEGLFRETVQSSPGAYYLSLRLQLARRLVVDTDLSMAETAVRTGFSSIAALSRAFRRQFGHPPSAARARSQT
jgi:AraC-like DNA-binding protein